MFVVFAKNETRVFDAGFTVVRPNKLIRHLNFGIRVKSANLKTEINHFGTFKSSLYPPCINVKNSTRHNTKSKKAIVI